MSRSYEQSALHSFQTNTFHYGDFLIFYEKRNRIFFGAPGTGKSYQLNKEKDIILAPSDSEYERVTFHPDYTYANFVGTYKPVSEPITKTIEYKYVPGPFMRLYAKAIANPKCNYMLIIEEINRANTAAVFGDIFQLLDRDAHGDSEYSIQASEDIQNYLSEKLGNQNPCPCTTSLSIPKNMYIWATMNSADQGVFPIDTAFKRRWYFEYMNINAGEELIDKYEFNVNGSKDPLNWNKLRKAINTWLAKKHINEDKLMGPFFLSLRDLNLLITQSQTPDYPFIETFKNKVLMYLFEDAAKQYRTDLFPDCTQYSEVCKKFENSGIAVFNPDIISLYESY